MTFVDLSANERLSDIGADAAELQPAGWPEAAPQPWIAAREGKQSGAARMGQERYN
jgi:hypothetical protein